MSLNGYDISNHQRGLNVAAVPGDFMIAKATEGTTFVDRYCDGFVQAAFNVGKLVGVYHFASGTSSGAAEAAFFVKNIKGYIGKAMLILDWEASAIKRGPGYAKDFLDTVYKQTGVRPVIYMSQSTCIAYNWAAVKAANYGLWVAAYYYGYKNIGYTPNCPRKGSLGAFGSAMMYQYTSSGRLPGYGGNLDLDVFYGDRNAWAKYAAKAGTAATTQPAKPAQKSVATLADEVIAGKWGTGQDRKNRLTKAGYDYNAVQKAVNAKLAAKKPAATYYTVRRGDTLSGIARKYGTTVAAIQKLSGIRNANKIYAGQKIRVK
jgi:GH25 family lysozyme M1 (1,4-beta-N-acetylmuramidase)